MKKVDVNIVIPLFNEIDVLPLLIDRLKSVIANFEGNIGVIFVDDGSSDGTRDKLRNLCRADLHFSCLLLSRNYGHQMALTAGLSVVSAEKAVMVIDGDLQDPPELLFPMYDKYKEGFEVVYAVRKSRKEGIIKRLLYYLFYRIANWAGQIDLPLDSGDFALMSRRVVDILNEMPESSRYLRGMRYWIGFKQVGLEYERQSRAAGSPKYNLKMLFNLAYNGIFNFSEMPIKILTRLGIGSICISLIYFVYTLLMRFVFSAVPSGFTALLFVVIMFGGVQLISIGILGEYILRIFFQVKNRPHFIIEDKILNELP